MKRLLLLFVPFVMLISACAPQAAPTQESVLPTDDVQPPESTPTQLPVELTPAQIAAVSALADITGLSADKISLVSTEAVTWPDGCLGVQRPGMMCTQALVDGFKIVLEADGKEYEFHTDEDGSAIVLVVTGETSGLVEDAIVAQLAQNLDLDKGDISVVSSEDVEFSDACMGVAMPDIMCAQVITPGRIIVLEADGIQYEYHTSIDGSRVQPATPALIWKREGGIAGFCDSMIVFLSGEVYTSNCRGSDGKMGVLSALLTAEERDQFDAWIGEFGQAELDASDPEGVADRMVLTLTFFGLSDGKFAASDEEALFLWTQDLFRKLNS
ncbi:MAG: hypothetical protein HXY35_01790 [Chloroflexi bacterium]|nr:hypothetical protein [Chloroflexota bacterium]